MNSDNAERVTINTNEALAMCGLSRSKFYKLVQRPDCDFAIKVGPKKYLIRKERFIEFLMKNDEI